MTVNFAPAPVAPAPIGGNLIDEDLDYRKKMAQQLMQAGMSQEPIQHWTQGLANMAKTVVGAMWQQKAAEREQELNKQAEQDMMNLYQPPSVTGGMPSIPQATTEVPPDGRAKMAKLLGGDAIDSQLAATSPQKPYMDQMKQFEGFTPKAQWDFKQNSNGYGTKARYPGEVIDQAEAEKRFNAETSQAASLVGAFAPNAPEGIKAALTSLTYNAGPKWMQSGLGDAVKRGDWETAKQIFVQYNKAGGQTNQGLVNRRNAEAQWFDGHPVQVADASGGYDRATLARMYRNPQTRDLATKIIISEAEARRKASQPLSALDQADLEYKRAQTAALQAKPTNAQSEALQREQLAQQYGLQGDQKTAFILTGRLPREDQQNLTATDKKAILEADDKVATNQNVLNALAEAEKLNPQAYSGATAGLRTWLGNNLPDMMMPDVIASPEGAAATSNLDNAVLGSALTQLKSIFGGNPTEGERAILIELQGSSNKPVEVRQRIFQRARELATARLAMNQREADQLRGGTFYKPGGGASGGPINAGTAPAGQPSAPEQTKVINGVTYHYINGQWYQQ